MHSHVHHPHLHVGHRPERWQQARLVVRHRVLVLRHDPEHSTLPVSMLKAITALEVDGVPEKALPVVT